MALSFSALRDDFDDNSINTAWTAAAAGSATVAESGAQAVITLPNATAGSHIAHYTSKTTYNLTGVESNIAIGTMVATGVAATAFFQLILDTNNYYQWYVASGTLKASKVVAGVETVLYSVAWNSSTYKYLRIRESGGTVSFDSSTSASAGATWTNRGSTTIASAFAVTALSVRFGASCGNIASPGSFRLDSYNLVLPALATPWHQTQAARALLGRIKQVTLSATGGQFYLATAQSVDGSGNLVSPQYWAGPLASNGITLTAAASQAAAQSMAVNLTVGTRFDLPSQVEARYVRLYHRSLISASSYRLDEYYPRRLVQADDVEAESLSALHIGAASITADRLFVLQLSAIAADLGSITAGTIDGAVIYAGGQRVILDADGVTIRSTSRPSLEFEEVARVDWKRSDGSFTGWMGAVYDNSQGANVFAIGIDDPYSSTAPIWVYNNLVQVNTALKAAAGLNVGTASGAATGQINTSGAIGARVTANTAIAISAKGPGTSTTTYSLACVDNSGNNTMNVRDDGAGFLKAAAWTYGSDRRWKHNIRDIDHDRGLETLGRLRPRSFEYYHQDGERLGFIAQEVRAVLPELVEELPERADDGTPYLGIRTNELIPLIILALQELDARTR